MYEITIKKTSTVKKIVGGDWAVIGQTPTTEEDRNKSWDANKLPPMKEEWGHTPKTERDVTTESEIYKQRVEHMDIVAVIKAINGMTDGKAG